MASNSSENLKNVGVGEKKVGMKSNALLNRYVPQIKQMPDIRKTKLKVVGKTDVNKLSGTKVLAPVKVQSAMPSSSEEEKPDLDILTTLYLQRQLLLAYVQEKTEFVTAIQNDEATVGIIDEYLTSEKNGFELLANEKVTDCIQDVAKIGQVTEALDILHPFVNHKDTCQQMQQLENTLSCALDGIHVNMPVNLPIDFPQLKQSVDKLDSTIHSNNLFSFNLDIEQTKNDIQQYTNISNQNVQIKSELAMKLSQVTSLKICEKYTTTTCKGSDNTIIKTEDHQPQQQMPLYQSTPFPNTQ